MGLPRRTNRTGLSDPELLILDFLFDKGGASFGMLASDEYSYAFHMNCDYDHGLTDDQLAATIQRLLNSGFISQRYDSVRDYARFSLTPTGGLAWEQEREPDWERYCDVWRRYGLSESETFHINCTNIKVGQAFVKVALACRLYPHNPIHLNWVSLGAGQICSIYWRSFEQVWSLDAPLLTTPEDHECDWDYYEQHRAWWRTFNELVADQHK